MSNAYKEQLSKSFKEKQKKTDETTRKIMSFYEKNGKITEEEKEEFLAIDESMILNNIVHMLYYVAKNYIETDNIVDFENYKEQFIKSKKMSLPQIPKEWEKTPERGKTKQRKITQNLESEEKKDNER
jgi:hypothetical protein